MNYFTKWYDDIMRRKSRTLTVSVSVEGLHQRHVGPSIQVARLELVAEPSTSFEVVIGRDVNLDNEAAQSFLDAALYGLLDVLLVFEVYPLRDVRITITRLQIDPVSSSQMAFRLAGRDAGTKIMAEIKRGSE